MRDEWQKEAHPALVSFSQPLYHGMLADASFQGVSGAADNGEAQLTKHVVSVPSRDGNECDSLGVVSDLLDETGNLLDDFVESGFGPLGSVHLVASNNELPHTESVGEESVLSGLTILGDTGFEFTSTRGNDQDGAISLGSTSDHVLDEISVTGGVDDGDHCEWGLDCMPLIRRTSATLTVLGGLEFPEGNV